MASIRSLIAGNWKMNGLRADGVALAEALAASHGDVSECDIALCPPFTLLAAVGAALAGTRIRLGAQDCHTEPSGAHTGDVSAEMLADLCCHHVTVGHSERRHGLGETDALVRAKAEAAHRAGLVPIICIGETLDAREAGETLEVVTSQILESVPPAGGGIVVAYEPVWAIGTGRVPTVEEVGAVHRHIRALLAERREGDGADVAILYGGSAKPDNAAELLAAHEVGGLLVGGASLDAASFGAIIDAAG